MNHLAGLIIVFDGHVTNLKNLFFKVTNSFSFISVNCKAI